MDHSPDLLRPRPSRLISSQVAVTLTGARIDRLRVNATLEYDTEDPYAVSVLFRQGPASVRWTFARDLLDHGSYEPTGMGEVHVWPCLGEAGRATVIVELTTDEMSTLVDIPAREVRAFLTLTFAAVPAGTESAHLDLDRAIAGLLPT